MTSEFDSFDTAETTDEASLSRGQQPARDLLARGCVFGGIFLGVAGLALITFGWAKVAGLAIVVLQIPYLISAGLTGLALVIVSVALIYVGVKRKDSNDVVGAMEELIMVVNELNSKLIAIEDKE